MAGLIRGVWAEVGGCKDVFGEQFQKPGMDGLVLRHGDPAPANAALIGDEYHLKAGGLKAGKSFRDPREKADRPRVAAVVDFFHQGSIAVEENCGTKEAGTGVGRGGGGRGGRHGVQDCLWACVLTTREVMKHVLCFGDSNTWGWDPVGSATDRVPRRHGVGVRWTGVAQAELGVGYRVVEEGLNGRTTVFEDPVEPGRCGRGYLKPCLLSHQPLDVVVLMLGTNDLKAIFSVAVEDIGEGVALLVRTIQGSGTGLGGLAPRVLLVSPPPVGNFGHVPELEEKFAGAPLKSRRLPALYEEVARGLGCAFLDSQTIVEPSAVDGLHLEAAEHEKLGRAIAAAIRRIVAGEG